MFLDKHPCFCSINMKSLLSFFKNISVFLILFVVIPAELYATHIRAGEITVRRISSSALTYEITLTAYWDQGSTVEDETATINLGDGTSVVASQVGDAIVSSRNGGTKQVIFRVTHTYAAPGTYRISYTQPNRNAGILNMSQSVDTPFSTETIILIDPFLGLNDTPILNAIPIDVACSGERYTHNPAAFDIDGDSLSFRLDTPQKDRNEEVDGYAFPDEVQPIGASENGGVPSFTIDPLTGTLTWDAPNTAGEYNVAFIVEEWRDGIKISEVKRDMQIIVIDCNNKRPEIIVPADTCVAAGSRLEKIIRATDPDGDPVRITSSGGVYDINQVDPPAIFNNPGEDIFFPSPASSTFVWDTDCVHIREQPYTIIFKAEDNPDFPEPNLADIKAWNVRVVGPQPENLVATPGPNRSIALTWDDYATSSSCSNANEMIIYRKEGCSDFMPGGCNIGLPTSTGYIEIARVPISQLSFTDTNNDAGLKVGLKYSYRLVASFPNQPDGNGGLSYASDEACENVLIDVPLPIRVSVENTDVSNGQILVKWTRPFEIDAVMFPPPYRYRLFRAEGLNGQDFTEIYSETDASGTKDSLEFTDTGLNTQDLAYVYRVALDFGGTNTFKDSSDVASSVRLTSEGANNAIRLTWEANTPWTNTGEKHRIYRDIGGTFVQIAEVDAPEEGIFTYTDNGTFMDIPLELGITYCYFVETSGTYDEPLILSPLINKSQISCAEPIDTIAPCPPTLSIIPINCDEFDELAPIQNSLTWVPTIDNNECRNDIQFYRLYYTPTDPGDFTVLIETTELSYIHNQINSFAGCYEVTAVDFAGNESDRSNRVCNDNCTRYNLPNVFTPNKDGRNDLFRAFPDFLFVDSVEFEVFNRWGTKVFNTSGDITIDWDGTDNSGTLLPAGTYFYVAKVKFITLRPEDSEVNFEGWVQIMY